MASYELRDAATQVRSGPYMACVCDTAGSARWGGKAAEDGYE